MPFVQLWSQQLIVQTISDFITQEVVNMKTKWILQYSIFYNVLGTYPWEDPEVVKRVLVTSDNVTSSAVALCVSLVICKCAPVQMSLFRACKLFHNSNAYQTIFFITKTKNPEADLEKWEKEKKETKKNVSLYFLVPLM